MSELRTSQKMGTRQATAPTREHEVQEPALDGAGGAHARGPFVVDPLARPAEQDERRGRHHEEKDPRQRGRLSHVVPLESLPVHEVARKRDSRCSGPPLVMTYDCVKIWNELMRPTTRLKNVTGEIMGHVMAQNLCHQLPPSISTASRSWRGTPWRAARKITMVLPALPQTLISTMEGTTVVWLASQRDLRKAEPLEDLVEQPEIGIVEPQPEGAAGHDRHDGRQVEDAAIDAPAP